MKKLKDTKHIHLNNVLRIYKKGFGYSRLVVIENNDYYLAAICNNQIIEYLSDGDIIEAYYWIEEEFSYDFKLKVIGKITIGKKIIFFEHTNEITSSSGRKCIGLESHIPIEFFVFDTGDENKIMTTEEVTFFNGEIIWLEDREAVLKSKTEITGFPFFKSHVKINDKEIEIIGKLEILNPIKNIYNIVYTGMNESDRNYILDHIYNLYRE